MPKFAANLTMMFSEWEFLDRFGAAADAGFTAVEYLFPYAFPADAIAERLRKHGLKQVLFNLPPGNWEAGERGLSALPERAADFAASLATAIPYAAATGVRRVHLMSGVADRRSPAVLAAYRTALQRACELFGAKGVEVIIEPLNPRDMPGYLLNDFGFAADLIAESKLPNLKLQYDIYHRQILHGDVLKSLDALLPIIGHIQVAAVPKRHEPGSGELNDVAIFRHLDHIGYSGFVGCEYRPAAGTLAGLGWMSGV